MPISVRLLASQVRCILAGGEIRPCIGDGIINSTSSNSNGGGGGGGGGGDGGST
jgi:hypothetical protein